MEGTIGEIRAFAGTSGGAAFVPRGWSLCDGSILPINRSQALFAVIGTTYSGNGIDTFAIPDLRSPVAGGAGTAPGRPAYARGQRTGTEQIATQPVTVNSGGAGTSVNSVAPAAGGNVQPVLGLSYIMCVVGAFPSN